MCQVELRHLRYFCAVAENQSFTLAARQLHVSQSGVSGQVRDLEREIGVRLLQRNQRDVSLTAEGKIFFKESKEILVRSEQAVSLVSRASAGQHGSLSIGLCGPATSPFLPRLIREFRGRHAGVNLELKDFEPARQPLAIVEGLIDVGFTRSVGPELRKLLHSEVFFREPLLAVLPKEHALTSQPQLRLAQLATDRLVVSSREAGPDLFDAIVYFCKRAGFSPRIVSSPSAWQSVLTLVEAGEGVALVPACVQYLRSKDVVFRPILDRGCVFDVIVAWRRNDPGEVRESFLTLLLKRLPDIKQIMAQN